MQVNHKPKSARTFGLIAIAAGGLILLTAIAFGLMQARMGEAPADVDDSTRQLSENGLFQVSYTASTGSVPINQMHQWTLHVELADGQPVQDAMITVDGDMPQHGHGMPTQPRVTQNLGGGDYLVEGMRFQMGGWWVVNFTITAGGQTDAVQFEMMLE